jgi:hypothetical protein
MPECDLPGTSTKQLMTNTNSLDAASLGGTVRGAEEKESAVRAISPHFDKFMVEANATGKQRAVRKVSSFVGDFFDVLRHLRVSSLSTAHWVLTTGNRTAAGMTVPLDGICKDMTMHLGGKPIADLRRQLPCKRMPSRNSQGAMITAETTTVVEFA